MPSSDLSWLARKQLTRCALAVLLPTIAIDGNIGTAYDKCGFHHLQNIKGDMS